MLIRTAADGRPGVRTTQSFGRFQIYYPPNRWGLTLPLADDDKTAARLLSSLTALASAAASLPARRGPACRAQTNSN